MTASNMVLYGESVGGSVVTADTKEKVHRLHQELKQRGSSLCALVQEILEERNAYLQGSYLEPFRDNQTYHLQCQDGTILEFKVNVPTYEGAHKDDPVLITECNLGEQRFILWPRQS